MGREQLQREAKTLHQLLHSGGKKLRTKLHVATFARKKIEISYRECCNLTLRSAAFSLPKGEVGVAFSLHIATDRDPLV